MVVMIKIGDKQYYCGGCYAWATGIGIDNWPYGEPVEATPENNPRLLRRGRYR